MLWNPVEPYGIILDPMESYGIPWYLILSFITLWNALAYTSLWNHMESSSILHYPISSHGIPWPMESSESYGIQWTSRYTYVSSCGPRVSYKSYRIKWNPIVSSRVSYIVIDHHFELYGILWNPTDS